MDLNSIKHHISNIIDGNYIIIDDKYIKLYHFDSLIKEEEKKNFNLRYCPVSFVIMSNNVSSNCQICDFVSSNEKIKEDLAEESDRLKKIKNISHYKYLDGWEYEDIYRNKFEIKDNKIIVTEHKTERIYDTYFYNFSYYYSFFYEMNMLSINPYSKERTKSIMKIFNLIFSGKGNGKSSETPVSIHEYYIKQKKIINRNEIINGIL